MTNKSVWKFEVQRAGTTQPTATDYATGETEAEAIRDLAVKRNCESAGFDTAAASRRDRPLTCSYARTVPTCTLAAALSSHRPLYSPSPPPSPAVIPVARGILFSPYRLSLPVPLPVAPATYRPPLSPALTPNVDLAPSPAHRESARAATSRHAGQLRQFPPFPPFPYPSRTI